MLLQGEQQRNGDASRGPGGPEGPGAPQNLASVCSSWYWSSHDVFLYFQQRWQTFFHTFSHLHLKAIQELGPTRLLIVSKQGGDPLVSG